MVYHNLQAWHKFYKFFCKKQFLRKTVRLLTMLITDPVFTAKICFIAFVLKITDPLNYSCNYRALYFYTIGLGCYCFNLYREHTCLPVSLVERHWHWQVMRYLYPKLEKVEMMNLNYPQKVGFQAETSGAQHIFV